MSLSASALRKLAALGLTAEQMSGVLDVMADTVEASTNKARSANAARQARYRERHKSVTYSVTSNVTNNATNNAEVTQKKEGFSPQEIYNSTPHFPEKKSLVQRDADFAFARFWTVYPNKVGKSAACKAFTKHFTKLEDILAGVQRYIRDKPPDQQWLNPATFLNGERWLDEPAKIAKFSTKSAYSSSGGRSGGGFEYALAVARGEISDDPDLRQADNRPTLDLEPVRQGEFAGLGFDG